MRHLLCLSLLCLATACGSSSSFSGSGSKEKPAKKTQDANAKPTSEKPKDQGKESDSDEPGDSQDLDNGTVTPTTETDLGQDTVTPTVDNDIDDDIKVPENVIVKGSFRVWTVPADPDPFVPYDIYIDVKLPSNASNYSQKDLSGSVVGTDGYSQPIGRDALAVGFNGQRFDLQTGRATLILSVPGALDLVKDTINIKSDLLNESQKIEIIF